MEDDPDVERIRWCWQRIRRYRQTAQLIFKKKGKLSDNSVNPSRMCVHIIYTYTIYDVREQFYVSVWPGYTTSLFKTKSGSNIGAIVKAFACFIFSFLYVSIMK